MVNNTYIIVQARMGSERLPGKVLMKIDKKPLIGILIERLKKAKFPVVIATSKKKEDDVLVKYANDTGVKTYRGSEENVLERYYFASKKFNAKVIIRITGDNPLIDGLYIKKTMEEIGEFGSRTFFSNGLKKSFPLGLSFEAFSFELLEEAYQKATQPWEKEHVTHYMHFNIPGDINIKTSSLNIDKSSYRLTVDTQADLDLMNILIKNYDCHKKSMKDIIEILDMNPQLALINQNVKQKDWKE